jgi:hypothetical protein
MPTFGDRGSHVVSARDSYGLILGSLDRIVSFSSNRSRQEVCLIIYPLNWVQFISPFICVRTDLYLSLYSNCLSSLLCSCRCCSQQLSYSTLSLKICLHRLIFLHDAWILGKPIKLTKLNSMVPVRERTIPTERTPLVGKVIANFLRIEGATWSAWRIPTAVFSVF